MALRRIFYQSKLAPCPARQWLTFLCSDITDQIPSIAYYLPDLEGQSPLSAALLG